MRKIILLLLLAVTFAGCQKDKKLRTSEYKCYAWHRDFDAGVWDTVCISYADFPYPLYPIQDQEDTLNAHLGGAVDYWYSCSY